MGFYVTDSVCTRRAKPGTPLKKSRLEFFSSTHSRAGFFASQPVEPHREKRPTPTIIVSGVRYYGYRYYSPGMGRWLSRDPIGEKGFELSSRRPKSPQELKRELEAALYSELQRLDPRLAAQLNLPFIPFYGQTSLTNELNCYDAFFNNPNKYIDPDGESAMAVPVVVVLVTVTVYEGVKTFCNLLHFYENLQRDEFKCAGTPLGPPAPSAARNMCIGLGWYNDDTGR